MTKEVACSQCGFRVRADSDDELVEDFQQLGKKTCLFSVSPGAISALSSRGFENSLAKSVRVTQPRNFSPSKTPSLVIRFSTIVFAAVFVDSSGPILKNGTNISPTLTSSGLLFSGTNFQSSARSVIKPTTFSPSTTAAPEVLSRFITLSASRILSEDFTPGTLVDITFLTFASIVSPSARLGLRSKLAAGFRLASATLLR